MGKDTTSFWNKRQLLCKSCFPQVQIATDKSERTEVHDNNLVGNIL